MTSPFSPVPKPRARLTRGSQSSITSLERCNGFENMAPDALQLNTGNDAPSLPVSSGLNHGVLPSLKGTADISVNSVPSQPAVADPIPTPSAPPPIDFLANIISTQIPVLSSDANAVANPSAAAFCSAPSTSAPAMNLESIFTSFANIPGFSGIVSSVANPVNNSSPSAPPLVSNGCGSPLNEPSNNHTDVEALSQLVISSLDPINGVKLPPIESPPETRDAAKEENPYVTVLSSWTNQEDGDTESSIEEELPVATASSDQPADNRASSNHVPLIPARPAPPRPADKKPQAAKQQIPRKATIRVSRKKGGRSPPAPQSTVVRNSWLDVWKGFRHNVYWVTMDGQLMSMWKKRSDRFSEILFHVSSITNVKKLDKGRFSVYFKKKRYDFLAHNDDVQEGWVTSLLATRGQPSPTPPEVHGQITIKETRSRAYAAVFGYDMWIYTNKDNFQLGIASFIVPLTVACVKPTGKQSFILTVPQKTLNLTVESNKDLTTWLNCLEAAICSALSCSQVALRLRENPHNKVCADCGEANPDWASVNLLLSICKSCADHHRNLSSNLSKVRSMLDTKIWTEPIIQLFVTYGNKLANQVWAPAVPAAEQLHPKSTDEERSKFIQDKYSRGRYRRVHPLSSSRAMMEQRLCQVVCTSDLEETMSLICSGAKVCPSDPQSPSPISLAEKANQALQMQFLRLNEYTEVPQHRPQAAHRRLDSTPTGEEEEELHGKLEEDRFLFSLENNSAACDVLDLREVLSVFLNNGSKHGFDLVTLDDQLTCEANSREEMLEHLIYILKVILPAGVSYAEVGTAIAVCKVCVVGVGGSSNPSDAWLLLWEDGVSIHPINKQTQQAVMMELSMLNVSGWDPSDNIITMKISERSVSLRFEESYSCQTWFSYMQKALANRNAIQQQPQTNQGINTGFQSSVSPAIERCISHITTYGLKVEGVYRRCGLATKVNKLVEALKTSPNSAPLEGDEQGVLDACSALKKYIRDQDSIVPTTQRQRWLQAAANPDESCRFKEYRRLLRQLPDNNKATLNALFGHFYMVQVFSQENKMSAYNLAVVLAPSLFQVMNQDMIQLTKEFIIHHTLLFLTPEKQKPVEEEVEVEITIL
ncbi:arf-GAP with Rho-GAP domain, ANK repeat and PH domain-containing protein 1 isoform X2 [Oryzias latipes]|uniref:Arf-GAP with Rho-GAP domain, ANK repeat and PH domain-containing protein 1-like n=1 Tax=Oryzias latipes TaxID=8090 RepID=A0A3B3I416_ORYLA|nr:arf-GAP with Rho-GAP domain, ANK repeat and PH domain-containing protein 1 isoform X2 [Oryzias latipes]